MNFLYRIFLTINSTLLIISIYLVKEQINFFSFFNVPDWISNILYFVIPFLLTGVSINRANRLGHESMKCDAKDIEQANNAYLPSYLGYFFVALSVPSSNTLIYVYVILFFFTFFSQTLYFNPLFLLWKYKFYYITKENNIKIFLISKRTIYESKNLEFQQLRRINDFTFIDMGGEK